MLKPKLVVLSGAGVSAESGLKTFRDSGGLWEGYDVYEVASPEGWRRNPSLILDFYNARRREILAARPNAAHIGIGALEEHFDVTVITQNIDDLHERAGSSRVIHLHGEIFKMRSSLQDSPVYPVEGEMHLGDLAPDGSQLRPFVVWFGEAVPLIDTAAKLAEQADILVVIGTSLNVYPAAGLLHAIRPGTPVYVIDKRIPPVQNLAGMHLIEKTASEGVRELGEWLGVPQAAGGEKS